MKTKEEKQVYLEEYLSKYFDGYLINDIKSIGDKKLDFTFPYILLVSAGIDFLGGLKEDFVNNNSTVRSCNFIKEWMSRVNPIYGLEGMNEIIYSSARCGISHQAIFKKGIRSSAFCYPKEKHLYHFVDSEGGDSIFLHALQFVEDFLKAQNLFRQIYIKNNPDIVYEHLTRMLEKEDNKALPALFEKLKKEGCTFDAVKYHNKNPRNNEIDKISSSSTSPSYSNVGPSGPPSDSYREK